MGDRLAEIRARLAAATPGPWVVSDYMDDGGRGIIAADGGGEHGGTIVVRYHARGKWREEDFAFIAAAREDVPCLLAEIERLADYARAADEAVGVVSAERDEARAEAERLARDVAEYREARKWEAEALAAKNDRLENRDREIERLTAERDAARTLLESLPLLAEVAGFCPQCGATNALDEDGCCQACGSTATGAGVDALRQLGAEAATLLGPPATTQADSPTTRPEPAAPAPCLCTACDWTGRAVRGAPCPACGGAMAWEWRRHKWGDKCVDPNCQRAHHLLTDEQLRERAARVAEQEDPALEAAIRRECERVGIPAPGEWERDVDAWCRWWRPDWRAALADRAGDGGSWCVWMPHVTPQIAHGPETGPAGRLAADRALLTWLRAQPDGCAP